MALQRHQSNRSTRRIRRVLTAGIAAIAVAAAGHFASAQAAESTATLLATEKGGSVTIIGAGFPTGANVSLTYEYDNTNRTGTATASAEGAFTATEQAPAGYVGSLTITARAKRTTATATATPSAATPVSGAKKEWNTFRTDPGLSFAAPGPKDVAFHFISTNMNNTMDFKRYDYIEYLPELGYVAGIYDYASSTGELAEVLKNYQTAVPDNALTKYVPAFEALAAAKSTEKTGVGDSFVADWKAAMKDPKFLAAQDKVRDAKHYDPALKLAKEDKLRFVGELLYVDTKVAGRNQPTAALSLETLRDTARKTAKTPAEGGDEVAYLTALLDARKAAMTAAGFQDTSIIDTSFLPLVKGGNLDFHLPLRWTVHGTEYMFG